jgi:hypothetical protein
MEAVLSIIHREDRSLPLFFAVCRVALAADWHNLGLADGNTKKRQPTLEDECFAASNAALRKSLRNPEVREALARLSDYPIAPTAELPQPQGPPGAAPAGGRVHPPPSAQQQTKGTGPQTPTADTEKPVQ